MTHAKLTHHVLIAPPNMPDPRFSGSLVYIAQHDDFGALGLIINQPTDISLTDVLRDLDIEITTNRLNQVLLGGPVRPEVGFVLHTGLPTWHSSIAVTDNVCLTTSKDILEAIACGQAAAKYQLCLGHAAWSPGQLEAELAAYGWFVVDADMALLFASPYHERYRLASQKAGLNFDWLSDEVGHA